MERERLIGWLESTQYNTTQGQGWQGIKEAGSGGLTDLDAVEAEGAAGGVDVDEGEREELRQALQPVHVVLLVVLARQQLRVGRLADHDAVVVPGWVFVV